MLSCALPQKLSLLQQYRPMTFFLCANLENGSEIVNRVRLLNGQDESTAAVTSRVFKDNPGLNLNDLREFGQWLLLQSKVGPKEVAGRLQQLRKQRLCRWHVFNAPDDLVIPTMSMHLSPVSLVAILLFLHCYSLCI